ncbi:reverse transcriptase domain, reverse transcriptase zinc-binding domain protein [Tanacetum coccineum]
MASNNDEWIEVRKKKIGSVFNRLTPPHKSLADDLAKISSSVYVSNFPSHLTLRELWNICGKKGTLVDVFIAKHKNKLGQSFGFCRFIKVTNPDDLILSLNQIRIGKLRLHANLARFDRNSGGKQPIASPKVLLTKKANVHFDSSSNHAASYVNVAKNSLGKSDHVLCSDAENCATNKPCINIPLDAPIDLPSALLGCFKDIRSIGNIRTLCKMEGFIDVEFKYLGGLWVLFVFNTNDAKDKFLNHKVVNTWFSTLKLWHDDFVVDERLIWIDVEGIPIRAWNNGTFSKICERWGEVIFMDDSDKW